MKLGCGGWVEGECVGGGGGGGERWLVFRSKI